MLPDEQIQMRINEGLVNKVDKGSTKTIPHIIFSNIFTTFNIIVILVSLWLVSVNTKITYYSFALMAVMNTAIGIFQEIKAKQAVDKLSLMTISKVKVIRSSKEYIIPTDQLLLDDVYVLTSGNEIPADSVIIKGEVEVNESLLTGESLAIKKTVDDYLLAGSYIISGSCYCRCDRIGEHNYVAQLQNKARKVKYPCLDEVEIMRKDTLTLSKQKFCF